LCSLATAQSTITGTVTNGTNGKPAANADVTLLSLMQGMQESGKTKTDASGKYSLKVPDQNGPHLVRVSFHDVNYNKMVPPTVSTADMTVYEAAKEVQGITVNVETAYQSDGGKLQAVQFYTVRNASNPPRTQAGDRAFVITVPDGAELDASRVQAPGGQPVEQAPTKGPKGEYAFSYPVRPGETMFQVGYHLAYTGEMAVTPKVNYPLGQFALVMPQAMSFEAKNASIWESPQHQGGITLKIASNAAGKDLSYRISGNGTLPDEQADSQGQGGGGGAQDGNGPRPGGGIGAPIDGPDPLDRYRLPLLTMLSGLLALGALFMVSRRGVPSPTPAQQRSSLLEELKEQLFELEIDRRQGRISQDDYTKSKAALDATMERALAKRTRA
jgi:5-hydroxyisourate hydrolase-like protein (transthyretin family)